ncbi:type VII secretion integral membrane protein EccD [Mycolicibacterium neoaurum]|uniref:type VII secretion integral membrane protein EccD n=1 Tax=Mycolicibacterium neoaurum TaxID=1795 RepID=UPI001F4C6A84|nr:type VII secretion integral membrane protein EccD [Mycolicibacterium neoaurum]
MDPATATGQVRVAIIGEGAGADLALPTTLAIRELIPRIRATLTSGRDDSDLAPQDAADIDGPRPYSLAPLGGTPFSLDATLETLNIDDGEQLILCKLPPGPAAPPVVEDIADAAAIHSASQFKPFNHQLLPVVAQVVVLALGALVCGLALDAWYRGYQWWAAAALGVVTVTFMASTVLLGRRGRSVASTRMGLATTVPLGLALAAALPGDAAAPRVFLATAGVVAWSLLMLVLTSTYVATYTAIVAVGFTVAGAAAVRMVWDLPYISLGCGILAVSLLVAPTAPTSSAVWARFPLPNVPAPGEPTPPAPSLAEIEALPKKTATSASYQSGLIATSVILAVLGSVLVVWLPDAPQLLAWWLVVATVTVTLLRMRIWDSTVTALWFLSAPFLAAVTLAISFVATGHLVAGLYATGAAIGLTVVLLIVSMLKPRDLTIPQRRRLDLFESSLLVTIVPTMLWLIGLVSLIRNRGTL